MSDIRFRPATADEFPAIRHVINRAFGSERDDGFSRLSIALAEPARNIVALDGDRIVGNAGAYTRDLSVPGAVIPAAHVTWVSVLPTHRRRGILRGFMHRQLRELHEARREPIAVLWASEARIYQRYGYGLASYNVDLDADLREVRMLPGPRGTGRLREATPGEALKDLAEVFDRVRPTRPGWSSRTPGWWDRVLYDFPSAMGSGFTPRHALLYETAEGCDGYALWRTRGDWGRTGPAGLVEVKEVVAATPEAYAELWRFLLSVDLMRTLTYMGAPDEPLSVLVDEPKTLGGRVSDGLWLRVVDVPAALSARRYPVPVDLVLEVTDDLLPGNSGRWRVTDAGCTATSDPADLALDVADLGAAYLGGTPLGTLAAAGRVRELSEGSLAMASAAFSWTRQPVSIEIF